MSDVRPICIIVAGVHRSGTSLLTGVLSLLGAQPPKTMVAAAKFNLKGFWEPLEILRLNETIFDELHTNWEDWRAIDFRSWSVERRAFYKTEIKRLIAEDYPDAQLFVLKEPRLTRLIPLYHEALTEMGVKVVYALSLRAPDEVVGSIRAANPLKSKNGAYLLWLRYVLDFELETRSHTRIFVPFVNLLQNWKSVCQNIAEALGVTLNFDDALAIEKLNAFISSDLVHNKSVVKNIPKDSGPETWAERVYQLLFERQFHRTTPADCDILDEIRTEFESNWPNYAKDSEASRLYQRNLWEKLKRELKRAVLRCFAR